MRIQLISLGNTPPKWVQLACDDYTHRLPKHLNFTCIERPILKRGNAPVEQLMAKEAEQILKLIPAHANCILLDVQSKLISTEALAQEMENWQMMGDEVVLIIGGPEGHHPDVLARANARWSISKMTFPHTLARVILLEQLYRAHTILTGHPYHK